MEISSQSSTKSSSQEVVNRSSAITNFTIPKKQRNILQDNTNNVNESANQGEFLLYNDEKEQLIELQRLREDPKNFLDLNRDTGYTLTNMQFVKNRKLENEFVYLFYFF
jgi:hypothetical protein